jgi:bifunctional non-homologous end joining protein LigD
MARTTKQPDSIPVDGRQVRLTNPDKVIYPAAGVTKRDVVDYYLAVARVMLPHIVGRPITRKRWPHGVGGEPFFEKNLAHDPPEWVDSRVRHQSRRDVRYPLADSPATLAWFAQLAALELHVPQWRFDLEAPGTEGVELKPDRLVLDLDPGPGVALAECATVARAIREMLGDTGESLAPVTSGSKGIHLYLALNGSMTSGETSEWAHALARAIERSLPDLAVSRMTKSLRKGKVFIDWSQNNAEKTTVAPYSLRGREQPMVAAPRAWEELDDPALEQLDFHDVVRRLSEIGDPMADLGWPRGEDEGADPEDLTQPAEMGEPGDAPPARGKRNQRNGSRDRLELYRSKRNASRTPEPVPDAEPDGTQKSRTRRHTRSAPRDERQATFVIQEHHARRLHWDFRLEHDGVLVSWAVPKGMPTNTRTQRLAVQTEDHPLEYGTFAGTIPRGEYGAGEVQIWDSGPYLAEKWRDDEVIAVLGGERASGRYALIRTEGTHWLLHRMKDQSRTEIGEDGSRPDGAGRNGKGPSGYDAARGRGRTSMPRNLSPMLATLGTAQDVSGAGWQWEGKWDGVRAIAEVADGAVSVHGRSGADFSVTYPELAELGEALADHTAVLDGEIVALGPGGAPSFGLLQQRIGKTVRRDVDAAAAQCPAHFYAFDILYLDGIRLTGKTLADRRRILERLGIDTEHCHVPELLAGPADRALAESRRRGLEGVVAKEVSSPYRPGKRPGSWIKNKYRATQDVIVVGWRPGKGRRAGGIGSLLLALPAPDRDSLVYAGRVGTGFDESALTQLSAKLRPLVRKTSPVADSVPRADASDAVWVRPVLVAEVTFAEFTADRRLRQASWRGLREGMGPADVTVEAAPA